MVVPQSTLPPAKVMSETVKDTTTARVPSMTLERGSAPVVEQMRHEPLQLVSATESNSELPITAPMKMPELPPIKSDTTLPLVQPASDTPLPKSDFGLPAAAPAPLPAVTELPKPNYDPFKGETTLPVPTDTLKLPPPAETLKLPTVVDNGKLPAIGEVHKPLPAPKPIDSLPEPAPSVLKSTLPSIDKLPELTIKPAASPDQFKPVGQPQKEVPPVAAPIPAAITPKLEEAKFTAPAITAIPTSAPPAVKTERVTTPKTDYDEDIVRVRGGDTYASLAKAHYEDDKYGAALKEYNRGIDLGLTREIQVPPLYVLKKAAKSSFDRFEPATRPVSATSPIISGPVLDAPVVKPDSSDLDWNKPGTPKRESNFSTLTTERDGLTPKVLAKQLLGDSGEWRKLTDARGQRFGEEEGLPKGTEVRYPKLQADWR
jgi:hypothetical protein